MTLAAATPTAATPRTLRLTGEVGAGPGMGAGPRRAGQEGQPRRACRSWDVFSPVGKRARKDSAKAFKRPLSEINGC